MTKLTKIVALTKEQVLVQALVQERQYLIKALQTGKMATLKKNSWFPEVFVLIAVGDNDPHPVLHGLLDNARKEQS